MKTILKLAVQLLCVLLTGCAMNFSEESRPISAGAGSRGIETLDIHLSVLETRDIYIEGVPEDTVLATATISRLALDGEEETPNNPELTIADGGIGFAFGGGDWFSATVDHFQVRAKRTLGVNLESTTGAITVKRMHGFAVINNTTGDISVETVRGCSISNTTGDVSVTLFSARDSLFFESAKIKVTTGDIVVSMPDTFAVRLKLKTTTGDISTPGGVADYLNGATDDSPLLACQTTTGDIKLRYHGE